MEVKDLLRKLLRGAMKEWVRLFIKNIALCELARGCIWCDT